MICSLTLQTAPPPPPTTAEQEGLPARLLLLSVRVLEVLRGLLPMLLVSQPVWLLREETQLQPWLLLLGEWPGPEAGPWQTQSIQTVSPIPAPLALNLAVD